MLPNKSNVYQSIEGLIHHFEVIMPNRGFPTPTESIYAATESPNGELGYYITSDSTAKMSPGECADAAAFAISTIAVVPEASSKGT